MPRGEQEVIVDQGRAASRRSRLIEKCSFRTIIVPGAQWRGSHLDAPVGHETQLTRLDQRDRRFVRQSAQLRVALVPNVMAIVRPVDDSRRTPSAKRQRDEPRARANRLQRENVQSPILPRNPNFRDAIASALDATRPANHVDLGHCPRVRRGDDGFEGIHIASPDFASNPIRTRGDDDVTDRVSI